MENTIAQEDKVGFVQDEYPSYESKEAKAIARLWNNGDGLKENRNWAIVSSDNLKGGIKTNGTM